MRACTKKIAFGTTEIAGERSITSSFLISLFVLKSSSSCGIATTLIAIRLSRELLSRKDELVTEECLGRLMTGLSSSQFDALWKELPPTVDPPLKPQRKIL
jgi:hypothetical protein